MIEKEVELSDVPGECLNCDFFVDDRGCVNTGDCPKDMLFRPVIRRPKRLSDA
ncbi:MAG: hypothetical protein V3R93_03080 [Candidatus Hydrothermarchaeaceae archaeon]